MKKLIGSVDRITGTTAYIILNDDEHVLQIPAELLPDGAAEGMAYTITIATARKNGGCAMKSRRCGRP